jgi:hypothetical protein
MPAIAIAILKGIWEFRRFLPYVAILLLGYAVRHEHAKLLQSRQETQTTKTELRVAADANRDDLATIAELQAALKVLTAQLGQANEAGAAAVAKASQSAQALQKRLVAAQTDLNNLRGNPSYASFLDTDLDALYPDLARGLRQLDSSGQD